MNTPTHLSRRAFIGSVAPLAGLPLLGSWPYPSFATEKFTVGAIIESIMKEVDGAPFPRTVDQLRTGKLDQEVTGIVTTMFPTMDVIQKTADLGANFIIAHETPFYNNNDETDWLQNDTAYLHKMELIQKHKIAIWRFHDYWHRHKPDGIIMGNLIKLGWEKHYDPNTPRLLTLPKSMPIRAIADLAKNKLGISTVRIVGNLKQECTRIYLAFGYMDSRMQIAAIDQYKPDLILSGETREWETIERVRDGQQMGLNTSIMVLSHAVSEEAGMEYAAQWLQPKVPGMKITHIPSTNPFTFY
ncbi:Nif3-like dinuclear metal center hexameric protein [Marinilongibacter aquaticus]|uniref:Nif3-like dinuclear metal center hexameric protein n=1 Tax=Marinilongibacter aquaticus TaxID=2975157 RepID=UPI0021BDA375|nr:Nif3-like dinuclear metal center hexameric protein [Marinilongibacter aquaticus]UBM60578.1 Nif3-like dinuclear metal center hexameric protein [Marinilongibacter aquaticus]